MIDVNSALEAHTTNIEPDLQQRHGRLMESLTKRASEFFELGENLVWCNQKLTGQGHRLLNISSCVELAPLTQVPDPQDAREIGSFPAGFSMHEWDGDRIVPITLKRLLDMHNDGMDQSMQGRLVGDHRDRPAFWRALVLAPALIINLTSDYSDWVYGERKRPLKSFGPELYLAYQVMSRLVDRSDPGVLKPNGRVDRGYLFDRRIRPHRFTRPTDLPVAV